MNDYWGIELETDTSRTTTGGFPSPEDAAEYLVSMMVEYGESVTTATIYKYLQ